MIIRKTLALLLILMLSFSLFGCCINIPVDSDDFIQSETPADEYDDSDSFVEQEPEETDPEYPDIDMRGVNIFEHGIEFSFVRAYHADVIHSPNAQKKGTSFTADEGSQFAVLHLDVTNTGAEEVHVSDLFRVFFILGDEGSSGFSAAVEPDTSKLNRSYRVQPGETVLVYYMYECADSSDLSNVFISVETRTEVYDGFVDFSAEFTYQEESPKFAKGDTITSDYKGNFAVTVADVYMSEELNPSQPAGTYTCWPDQEDSRYLIVKLSVKNLAEEDLSYWNIAGVSCKHNDADKYEAFFVVEKDGGQDLSLGGTGMILASQEENVMYFAMAIPNEVADQPLNITMYVGNEMYTCNFSA